MYYTYCTVLSSFQMCMLVNIIAAHACSDPGHELACGLLFRVPIKNIVLNGVKISWQERTQ